MQRDFLEPGLRIEPTIRFWNITAFHVVRLTWGVLTIASLGGTVHACGGCYRLPYQSLLEKIGSCDRVIVAHAADPSRRYTVEWVSLASRCRTQCKP